MTWQAHEKRTKGECQKKIVCNLITHKKICSDNNYMG